jgi:3-isopropylmalate/(R)-2-methylmalate dehydratase small subunit
VRSFERVTATAAPLLIANVDTDKVVPARFLKTISRDGLGNALFHSMRFDGDGRERPDFVLNRVPWRDARILIARDNFGCGSSREHAPWALADFGFRCLIAPSFADIFYNNCLKNGILPITLDGTLVEMLLADVMLPERATLAVDLPEQTIRCWDGSFIHFEIAPEHKRALLLGLDDIAETLALADAITAYEQAWVDRGLPVPANIGRGGCAPLLERQSFFEGSGGPNAPGA